MAAQRATSESRSRLQAVVAIAAVLAVAVIAAVVFRSTQGADETASRDAAPTTAVPETPAEVRATPVATTTAPRPTVPAFPAADQEAIDAALSIERAPLGTFVVAKPEGGIPARLPPGPDGQVPLEIPVFDEPFGSPRMLVSEDIFGAIAASRPLIHGGADSAPLVLRVIAGGPDDEWIQVQAPVYRNDRSVWVQSLYFDFGFTTQRIEVDLAAGGRLRLIDGGAVLVDTPVATGRRFPPTPVGATFITHSGTGYAINGAASVGMQLASFREIPGLPSDDMTPVVLHGSTGQETAETAGGLGVPSAVMADLARRVGPGTPVLVFNTAIAASRVNVIAEAAFSPATTVIFGDEALERTDVLLGREGDLWERCAARDGLVCPVARDYEPQTRVPVGNVFLTAKPNAGQQMVDVGKVIPVYDEPGGPKRMLVDFNWIDGVENAYPLYHPNLFDQPLVLRVLQGAPGDEWILVQAPIRPHRQSVWVRAEDFAWGQTLKRIEIDLGRNGLVTLFEQGEEVISTVSVYGREARPTVLHDTYVEQVLEGKKLSPAYGTYIFTLASYSESLGTFGGGGMPGQSLHGTNQPELIGQRVSSGGIRVPNEVIEFMYLQPGMVGANVILFDSSGIGREAAIRLQRFQKWFPARSTSFPRTNLGIVGLHSYS